MKNELIANGISNGGWSVAKADLVSIADAKYHRKAMQITFITQAQDTKERNVKTKEM